jgi:4-hydroxyphenylpyruvate dioxygenase
MEMVATDKESPSQPHLNTRENPMTEKFEVISFHHLEFYCGDATSTYKRFMNGLGLDLTAKSDQSTGNKAHASYLVESNNIKMIFTAPYRQASADESKSKAIPSFTQEIACDFFDKHGLGVRAVAIEVGDVKEAFGVIMGNGGVEIMPPTTVQDENGLGSLDIAEVALYGDVALRLISSKNFRGKGLPNFKIMNEDKPNNGNGKFGLYRFDHVVGNLHDLQSTIDRFKALTGFHEFAEFDAEDVGTVDSGLNSVVMACNNQKVLLPLNEPTFGTKRKSQIQTYLEQNQGEGVQHIALFTTDIIKTMTAMKALGDHGGFEFQDSLGDQYYESLRSRLKMDDPNIYPRLSEEQLEGIKKLGILADRDDQGILLQIFTRPVGDRPTLFLEIIQRIGCDQGTEQKPGCGGFGKGNFKDLFKSIENFENSLKIN